MKPDFAQYGFPYSPNLIQAFIGGSQLHGAKVGGTDDTDWYGVFIEPPNKMIGLDRDEFFVFTTGGKRGGNGPQDVDVCLYPLRKWAGMAAKGNPSALHFVFAREEFSTVWWTRIVQRRDLFASKRHVKPFLKFADDQMERLCGRKGQKNVHRAALERQHGYDTKYAMHLIRLYLEAKEYMETGKITLPNPRVDLLIGIRQGEYKRLEIEEIGKQLQSEAMKAHEKSLLPEAVDLQAVSRFITDVYMDFWNS
ncbi:MAG TPA: nucleotidyltransferase domain-containing protein [Candidatus Acidoferrales bacterium]|nr:nucleotidyltransferase domain-containing protein [Candidatus Acidoferrales bacterium]